MGLSFRQLIRYIMDRKILEKHNQRSKTTKLLSHQVSKLEGQMQHFMGSQLVKLLILRITTSKEHSKIKISKEISRLITLLYLTPMLQIRYTLKLLIRINSMNLVGLISSEDS